jgi:WD40 repeat protein
VIAVLALLTGATHARAQDEPKIEIVPTIPHSAAVVSVAFSPDGARVLSGSGDKTIKLWDAATGALIRTFEGHVGPVTSVAFSPDGARVLSGSGDKTIKLWDAATGALIRTFEGHVGPVTSVAFSPDGARVVSGSHDNALKLWDAATGVLIRTFEGHSDQVASVAFSPDGAHVLSGSHDKTLKLWHAATGRLIRTLPMRNSEGSPEMVTSVLFSPDGARALAAGMYGTLKLLDAATGDLIRTFEEGLSGSREVALSTDGARVLSGSFEGALQLWETATGKLVLTFRGHGAAVASVGFSPDGASVVSGSVYSALKLWDASTGQLLRSFQDSDNVSSMAFSPDGKRLLSGNPIDTFKLWDAATGKLVRSFEDSGSGSSVAVAFSPDGKRLLSGSELGTLDLWDAATGKLIRSFQHAHGVNSVAFSPDGKRLLSGSDPALQLWDAATGKLVRTFQGHSGLVAAVAFSPDGARVLSGSHDKTLKLWDAATGRLIRTFEGHSDQVAAVAFSPDGNRLVSGSNDATIRLWDVATGAPLVTLVGGGESRWLATTPAGFFDASDAGLDMLSVVRGLKVFSVDQFRDQLQRKDLVRERLGGDQLRRYAKEAAQLSLEEILASGAPPEIELVRREIVGDSVRLTVRLSNNTAGGIGTRLKWRVNGVIQGNIEPEALKAAGARRGPVTVTQLLKLDAKHDNIITVTAYNGRDLLATRPFRLEVSKGDIIAPGERRPRLQIVAIGVNTYSGDRLRPLQLAVTDVTELAAKIKLVAEGGGYEVPEPIRLVEKDATKEGITRTFDDLALRDFDQQDALIVILAGHGLSDGKCYYYVPYGATFGPGRDITTEGVGCDLLERLMGNVQAGKKALFIDTCESAIAVGSIGVRGEDVERESTIERLSKATGHSIFTAARDAAFEDSQLGHGLLTYAVLQALAKPGPRGDVDADGIKLHVEDEVPRLSQRWYQQRQKAVVQVRGAFPLGPPQLAAAPAVGAAPVAGKYFLLASTQRGIGEVVVRETASSTSHEVVRLKAPRDIQVFEFHASGWVLIGAAGKKIGWVPQENVVPQ